MSLDRVQGSLRGTVLEQDEENQKNTIPSGQSSAENGEEGGGGPREGRRSELVMFFRQSGGSRRMFRQRCTRYLQHSKHCQTA